MIEFTIITFDSNNFQVENVITVQQLKEKVRDQMGIDINLQRLIFCGRDLQDEKKLSEYDVNGKVVHLLQRAPPSPESRHTNSPSTSGNNSEGSTTTPPQPRRETRSRRNEVTVELRESERDQTLRERSDVSVSDSTDDLSVSDSTDDQERESTAAGAELERLVEAAAGAAGPVQQLFAVRRCGVLLAPWNNDRRRAQLVAAGALPVLVGCLRRTDCPALLAEAAQALGDAAYMEVVQAGVVPGLLPLLESPHEAACEQALEALGIIVSTVPKLRDHAIELGAVPALLSLIKPDTPIAILRKVPRVIRWLCYCRQAKTIQEILPALNTLIGHTDSEVLRYTAWAIRFIAKCGTYRIQMVVASGVVPGLVPLLAHGDLLVQWAALWALDSIAAGTAEQAQAVLDCGALAHFPALLSHQDEGICEKALGFLANITAGNEGQVQAVIDAGLLPDIVEQLSEQRELGTQREAARAVRSLSASASEEQVAALIANDAIPQFCDLLGCEDIDLIDLVLASLVLMLQKAGEGVMDVANRIQECGGRDRIQLLWLRATLARIKANCDIIEWYLDNYAN